ncbi:MAG: metallophosphoesterase [Eubacteriales bacterium]
MIYVTSDIHGNFQRYKVLLDTIKLGDSDALIILGDLVDRGSQSTEIILDLMNHDNIFPILGNHDQCALACLKVLSAEVTDENIADFEENQMEMMTEWLYNLGGNATLESFKKCSKAEQNSILDFLEDLPLSEEFTIKGQKYLLVHAGLENFSPEKALEDYQDDEILWARTDYSKQYFEDIILVTGHTPTIFIKDNPRPNYIYQGNNHIALDCGCGFEGGRLGCICLNTMEEFYV